MRPKKIFSKFFRAAALRWPSTRRSKFALARNARLFQTPTRQNSEIAQNLQLKNADAGKKTRTKKNFPLPAPKLRRGNGQKNAKLKTKLKRRRGKKTLVVERTRRGAAKKRQRKKFSPPRQNCDAETSGEKKSAKAGSRRFARMRRRLRRRFCLLGGQARSEASAPVDASKTPQKSVRTP